MASYLVLDLLPSGEIRVEVDETSPVKQGQWTQELREQADRTAVKLLGPSLVRKTTSSVLIYRVEPPSEWEPVVLPADPSTPRSS